VNAKADLLYISLSYWTRSKTASTHPLDFYCSVAKPDWSTVRKHDNKMLANLVTRCLVGWSRDLADFDTRSLVWSLNKFDFETVIKVINMKDAMQTTLPPDVVAKLTMSLASLEAALLEKDPMMPQHLRASHQLLISYPETVHLLDDDEIARLISAAQIHTQIEIVKAGTAKAGGRKKISADDL
jgi:hypothetical protein